MLYFWGYAVNRKDIERIRAALDYSKPRMEISGKGSAATREVRKGKRKYKHLNHLVWVR